jgi:hypothetical protein
MGNIKDIKPRGNAAQRSYVELSRDGKNIERVDVYVEFTATWRGSSVLVTVKADRNAATDSQTQNRHLTPWRCYIASDSVYSHQLDENEEKIYGTGLTEAAVKAFNSELVPMARDIVENLDLSNSICYAVKRSIVDAYKPGETALELVSVWHKFMTPEQRNAFIEWGEALLETATKVATVQELLKEMN